MTVDRIFATLAGPAFVALVILFFRLGIRKGLRERQASLPDGRNPGKTDRACCCSRLWAADTC